MRSRLAPAVTFATLVPAPDGRVQPTIEVDDDMLQRLRTGDADAAREAFRDHRIRALSFR